MMRLNVVCCDPTPSHAAQLLNSRGREAPHGLQTGLITTPSKLLRDNRLHANRSFCASAAQPGLAAPIDQGDQHKTPLSEPHVAVEERSSTNSADEEAGGNGAGPSEEPVQQASTPVRRGLDIRIEGVKKYFRTGAGLYRAVDDVNVHIRSNSLTALLGPSGSGKTTLLRMIAGLEQPTAGKMYYDGVDATKVPVEDRNIGFVFQNYALFQHMTVADNIAFGPKMRKLDIDIEQRVEELLELVELPGLGSRYPTQLSGGQRQRVAVARALACDPRLLLMDEPFGALDPVVRNSLRDSLLKIVQKTGVTGVIVTHDQDEAFDLADYIVVFNKGKVEQADDPFGIARRPRTAFVMNFIGDTNTVPAQCLLVKRMGFATDKPLVMFRPRDVEIFVSAPPGDPKIIPATIMDKKHIGWVVKYFLTTDEGTRFEKHVLRDVDDELYGDLDTLQRVFVKVKPLTMMGYSLEEVDSSPLDLV